MVTIYFVTIIILMVIFVQAYHLYSDVMPNRSLIFLVLLSIIPIFNTAWLGVSIYQGVTVYIKEGSIPREEKRRRVEDAFRQLENAIDLLILRFKK